MSETHYTSALEYAHMLATVNPKHVASLVRFFESGIKPVASDGFGVEIEHLPIHAATGQAANYYEPEGIEAVLTALAPYYDKDKEYWDNGRLVGLGRKGIGVSLEPGGQLECSLGVLRKPEDLLALYREFRRDLDPILERLHLRIINYGYQPNTSWADIPVIPKHRYAAMTDYLGHVGRYGLCMMRGSASTQVSIDYQSEADAVAKMRLGTAVGPILAWFFRNSPFFEGGPNPFPLLRQEMWDNLDPQRCSILPGLYKEGYGFEANAVNILSTPLMVADLSHTPEYEGDEPVRVAYKDNAGDVYPDRELNDYEVSHILSTHFNDVRLKNFIEFRHWDSLPIERAERLTEIINSLYYVPSNRIRLESYFDGLTEEDVFEAKANIQAHGRDANPYGQPLDFWREFLGLEGLLDDIPGDPKHPDVFQR